MRRLKLSLTLVGFACSAATVAAEPVTLWNGITTAMTKAEVKALFPRKDVEIGQGCYADLDPVYQSGKVDRIRLSSTYGDRKDCGAVVITNLKARYGEPEIMDSRIDCEFYRGACSVVGRKGTLPTLVGQARDDAAYEYYRFRTKDIEILASRGRTMAWTWNLVYRPISGGEVDPSIAL